MSPILHVGTYPAGALIKSGILLTIEAQVISTVAGLFTTTVVVGSPSTVQVLVSNSSGAYTFPIHSLSITIPSLVVVTTALMPVALPFLTTMLRVVAVVDVLVPSYGYTPIPPCTPYTGDDVCPGVFFDLPLYPTAVAPQSNNSR